MHWIERACTSSPHSDRLGGLGVTSRDRQLRPSFLLSSRLYDSSYKFFRFHTRNYDKNINSLSYGEIRQRRDIMLKMGPGGGGAPPIIGYRLAAKSLKP